MRFFTYVLDPTGCGVPNTIRAAYESLPCSRGFEFEWQSTSHVAVLTAWDDPYGDSLVAAHGDCIAAGTVRLDNRAEVERWAGHGSGAVSDLELVLRTVARHGTIYIPQFIGDFAFVVWDASARLAIAASDTFSLKPLYYAERNGLFVFGSRAEALVLEERYEVQYLAEKVAYNPTTPGLTVYVGVRAVPAATMAVVERDRLTLRQYWSADAFEPDSVRPISRPEAVERCRQLLIESVRVRLDSQGGTWAQLSGGVDSSSIVSVAQWLVENGVIPQKQALAGTVTYVPQPGSPADEREFSDAVVRQWPIRNEVFVDPPVWYDDVYALPYTDDPDICLWHYPRDCRVSAMIRAAGGRVVLTGLGSDDLFNGNRLFFADWLVHGRLRLMVRELVRRAAIERVSFWELAYHSAVLPLLPQHGSRGLLSTRARSSLPMWYETAAARQYGIRKYGEPAIYRRRIGRLYHDTAVMRVGSIVGRPGCQVLADNVDVRHPFLYRPLVEFALQLPPELCAQPHARKWVLRESMRGILPDRVRTRVSKGGGSDLETRSFSRCGMTLDSLLHEPILADLGVVDGAKLRAAFDTVRREQARKDHLHTFVIDTLNIEAWLQRRSGRWPRGGYRTSKSGSTSHSNYRARAVNNPHSEGTSRRYV